MRYLHFLVLCSSICKISKLYETMSYCPNRSETVTLCFIVVFCIDASLFYKLSRKREQVAVLEQAVDVYTTEFERFVRFIRYYSCFFCFYCSVLVKLLIAAYTLLQYYYTRLH